MVFASSSLRRSSRLARANWLARLRPRAVTVVPVTLIYDERRVQRIRASAGMSLRPRPVKAPQRFVQQIGESKRAATYGMSRLRPRKAGKVIYRPKPQVNLSKPVRKREVFIMTKNPLFTEHPTTPQAAPRECTGWNCVCVAPAGYGADRLNWCRFYDSPVHTAAATGLNVVLPSQRGLLRSATPVPPALLPFLLATLGLPILPSSPRLQ